MNITRIFSYNFSYMEVIWNHLWSVQVFSHSYFYMIGHQAYAHQAFNHCLIELKIYGQKIVKLQGRTLNWKLGYMIW